MWQEQQSPVGPPYPYPHYDGRGRHLLALPHSQPSCPQGDVDVHRAAPRTPPGHHPAPTGPRLELDRVWMGDGHTSPPLTSAPSWKTSMKATGKRQIPAQPPRPQDPHTSARGSIWYQVPSNPHHLPPFQRGCHGDPKAVRGFEGGECGVLGPPPPTPWSPGLEA